MLRISELETRLLEMLCKYRYLTHSQMAEMGIGHVQHLRKITKKLCSYPRSDTPLMGAIRFPPQARTGHVENVYSLTPFGAEVLAEILSVDVADLNFQKVTSVFNRDYLHRKCTIDFQIRLDRALAPSRILELETMDRYFDKTGGNHRKGFAGGKLRSKTRADFSTGVKIIPDMNFVLRGKETPKARAAYCLEVINGHNALRVLRQIKKHVLAMHDSAIKRKYDLRLPTYTVLFLFVEPKFRDIIRSRFSEIDEQIGLYDSLFYFGLVEDTFHDVVRCWQRPRKRGDEYYHFISGKESGFTP